MSQRRPTMALGLAAATLGHLGAASSRAWRGAALPSRTTYPSRADPLPSPRGVAACGHSGHSATPRRAALFSETLKTSLFFHPPRRQQRSLGVASRGITDDKALAMGHAMGWPRREAEGGEHCEGGMQMADPRVDSASSTSTRGSLTANPCHS